MSFRKFLLKFLRGFLQEFHQELEFFQKHIHCGFYPKDFLEIPAGFFLLRFTRIIFSLELSFGIPTEVFSKVLSENPTCVFSGNIPKKSKNSS